MRKWNLKSGDPLCLTLAADARFGPTDYLNDQIWQLALGSGEPPALALQTTYGLRARALRIFPRFSLGSDEGSSDPAAFAKPPLIHTLYPNYLQLSCAPFEGIDVALDYWVPTSQVVCGRAVITNNTKAPCSLRLEWVSLLNPNANGERMAPAQMGNTAVLAGRSGNLAPVLFLTGSPQADSSPYSSLTLMLELAPGQTSQAAWGQAALAEASASYELAQQYANRNWDAEIARLHLSNASLLEIHTGDPDWDATLALAQKTALGLIHTQTEHLPAASFVSTRLPDQGYSMRGDGSDYTHLWNGQTPLESVYLASFLLPTAPALARGLLENFLFTRTKEDAIDWKPGLAGQRGQYMAAPMLASLAWRIYQSSEDLEFLKASFPALLAFAQAWFAPSHSIDNDGIPEWDHPLQTGFDDHPLFSRWHAWCQGLDPKTVESPDLCSWLYRECQALIQIARLVEREETIPALESLADHLKTAVEASWNEADSCYHYWDRDTHASTARQTLGSGKGPGQILVGQEFAQAVRVVVRVQTQAERPSSPQIFIHGASPSGEHRVERISEERFRWHLGVGRATSERVYASIEHILVQDILEEDEVLIESAGHTTRDHTLLLPLWAGISPAERARALIKNTLGSAKAFWAPYGLRANIDPPAPSPEAESCSSVHMIWNALAGEGLLTYGQRARAADLMARLMKCAIQNLKREGAFYRLYDAQTGRGLGERNALAGLPPLGLFLDILGVRILTARRVFLSGSNPFPWPVTVKYQGLTILRQKKKTMVIFPDGQNITVRNDKPQIVTLES